MKMYALLILSLFTSETLAQEVKTRPEAAATEVKTRPEAAATEVKTRPEADKPAPLSDFSTDKISSNIWDELDNMPPRFSSELAMQVIYGNVPYFAKTTPAWVGFALKVSGGKHFGDTRIGYSTLFATEGPTPEIFTIGIEPHIAIEHHIGSFALGASVGPDFMMYTKSTLGSPDRNFGIAPSAAFNIGYSQPWSRITRRVFCYVEPRIKRTNGNFVPSVALAIGSGRGR
jgi:hypothetical protein